MRSRSSALVTVSRSLILGTSAPPAPALCTSTGTSNARRDPYAVAIRPYGYPGIAVALRFAPPVAAADAHGPTWFEGRWRQERETCTPSVENLLREILSDLGIRGSNTRP